MATISSTLKMFDAMTRPLNNITQALNLTFTAMDNLQNKAEKDNNLTKTFDIARQRIADAEAQLNMMADSISEAENRQEKFNNALRNGEDYASGLLKKITGLVGAYLGYRSAKGFFGGALEAANEQIEAEQRLQSIMGNINGMTQDGINLVKNYAKEIENVTGVASNVGIFGQSQLAQYVYDPANIVALTDSMYNLATETYGVGFTMDQVMQTGNLMGKVMLGDINALSRNGFNMDAIFTKAEQQLLKTGTEGERAALVIEMIEENLDGLAKAMRNTPEGAIHALGNAWGSVKTVLGYGLIPMVLQLVDTIEANMPMIQDVFMNVFYEIFQLMEKFISISGTVANFFVENWSEIEPIIWGVVAGLGALWIATQRQAIAQAAMTAATVATTAAKFAATLATKGLTAAWATLNAVMKANVIIFVISSLVALGVWLYKTWQKNDDFAAGLMRVWNSILNFFSTIPAYFWQLVEWLIIPFEWWAKSIGKIYDFVINSILKGINKVLELVNSVTGSSYKIATEFSFENIAQGMKEYAQIQKTEAYANATIKAVERERKLADMMENRAAERALKEAEKEARFQPPDLHGMGLGNGMWDVGDNTLLNVDKVGEVGKIKDKVDISSEDLKLMRESAEMKSIQNFISLQPSVTMTHTGDVNNGYDIDTITSRITDALNTEIAIGARSVLNV